VDEFRADLDRDLEPRHAPRPATPADAVARLEHEHGFPRAKQFIGSRQPGGTSTNDEYIEIRGQCANALIIATELLGNSGN
jgi:hypothetical protein